MAAWEPGGVVKSWPSVAFGVTATPPLLPSAAASGMLIRSARRNGPATERNGRCGKHSSAWYVSSKRNGWERNGFEDRFAGAMLIEGIRHPYSGGQEIGPAAKPRHGSCPPPGSVKENAQDKARFSMVPPGFASPYFSSLPGGAGTVNPSGSTRPTIVRVTFSGSRYFRATR